MRAFLVCVMACATLPALAGELEQVQGLEIQPLVSATRRLLAALDAVGAPLVGEDREILESALRSTQAEEGAAGIQTALDRHCLVQVTINPESRVKVKPGPALKELVEQGWRTFLVKVHNEAGVTAVLRASSPNAAPLHQPSEGSPEPKVTVPESEVIQRFLDLDLYYKPPLKENLSGLPLEYCILQIYCRDRGTREATLQFDVGQGTQDLGFRNEVALLFRCVPAVEVELEVLDHDGRPTIGWFLVRDALDRVYPCPSRRLAPDFFFHDQIYRGSGESVRLPPGTYAFEYGRGPEYRVLERTITVPDAPSHRESFTLERWIHVAKEGWRSGDHHVHAAGCAHYESPAQGVRPEDMMRHIVGEDLNVGCVLSWGPCWYFQKQFFTGKVHESSTEDYVMRYDVEVSGFPSSHAGHLVLLRLKEDDYPGTQRIDDWPSYDLPILQWGKSQGAVTGFSHSGFGLQVKSLELPTLEMPPFDGIGANEYIVDVAHDAVDFISAVDTPAQWELNIWYHTLNCGFRCRLSGETDFPCIYGERVGLGRVYVKMPEGRLDFEKWVEGLRDGRSYVSDGNSHLLDFAVGGVKVGERGSGGIVSRLDLDQPGPVIITARAAALLPEQPDPEIKNRPIDAHPFWHLERARIEGTRKVPVELIVNGRSLQRVEIVADGTIVPVRFEFAVERSSWIALRILPSSHLNPVFVEVSGQPIRASRDSARWCLQAVEVCWKAKESGIKEPERAAARSAYDAARQRYAQILSECAAD